MIIDNIEYLFITPKSEFYSATIELRYKVFYEQTNSPYSCVYDDLEDSSFHLLAVSNSEVVGYLRLTIENGIGQLTQFLVLENMRGKARIAHNLFMLMIDKAKKNNVHSLWGEIRLHMDHAARYYGFTVFEEIFPSEKTGIPHKRIEMVL